VICSAEKSRLNLTRGRMPLYTPIRNWFKLKISPWRPAMALDSAAPVKTFRWQDPFDLESRLTEDERMIRDTARAYAQDKLLPRVNEAYLNERPTARSSTRWASSACSA
jgi:hypothetical protein